MIQQIALELGYYESLPKQGDLEGHCDILPCHSNEFPSPVKRPAYSVLDKRSIRETFGVEVPYWVDSLEVCIDNIIHKS
jgi:dTDP-4-dehydrorhamnose reductase